MNHVFSGEGDFCIEFLIPLLYPNIHFKAIYNYGLFEDSTPKERVNQFLRAVLGDTTFDVDRDPQWRSFYGDEVQSWPVSVPDLLRALYFKAGANVEVVERRPGDPLDHALVQYVATLEATSASHWSLDLNSESARIILRHRATGEERAVTNITNGARGVAVAIGSEPHQSVTQILADYELARVTGERSIIAQFSHGLPTFIPFYMRGPCVSCVSPAVLSQQQLLFPIYARDLARHQAFKRDPASAPWGLLWDLFNIPTKTKSASGDSVPLTRPNGFEAAILRSARRESVSYARRWKAATEVLAAACSHFDGLSRARVDSESCIAAALPTPSYFDQSFYDSLWTLIFTRRVRRAAQVGRAALASLLRAEASDIDERDAGGSPFILQRLKELVAELSSLTTDEELRDRFSQHPRPLGEIEHLLRDIAIGGIMDAWRSLEPVARVSPYKAFALLPFFPIAATIDQGMIDVSRENLCLGCCRLTEERT